MILRIAYIVTVIAMFIGIHSSKSQDTLGLKKDTIFVKANNDSILTLRPLITFRSKNGHKLAYNEMPLSNLKLSHLINEYPLVDQRNLLMKEFKKMKLYNKIHIAEFIVGLGIGGYSCIIGGMLKSLGDEETSIPFITTGVVIFSTQVPLSIIAKHKFLKKRRQLVTLYNKSLL